MIEAARTLFDDLVKGDSETDIADTMGWDPETFAAVKKAMLDGHAEAIRTRSTEHTYIDYIIAQRQNVRDLSSLIKNLDKKQQYNALVGAIRLRSEITDKILERGVEFGIVHRENKANPGGTTYNVNILGVRINEMETPALRDAITDQLKELEGMIKKYGDGKGILDMEPGPLHYGPPSPRLPSPTPATVSAPKAPVIRRAGGKKRASGEGG